MADSSVHLKVGAAFLAAAVILFAGIIWLKEYRPAAATVVIRVVFDDANGISSGDPVTVSGIKMGEVVKVTLNPENLANVELAVDRAVRLHPDASFTIRDMGLMGDKAVVVNPGIATGLLDVRKPVDGTVAPGIDRLIASTGEILGNLTRITERIDHDLDVAGLADSMEKTLAELRMMSDDVRRLARGTEKPLAGAIDGVRSASDELRRFVQTNEPAVARAVNGVHDASGKLTALVDSLSALGAVIDTLSTRLEKGEGTFAKFVRSGEIYEELRHTNASIDSFVIDFKRDPGKYTKDIHLKLRLF